MALFGSLMSEFDDEPLLPSQMNGMSHIYNLFGDPFGMMMGSNALTDANHRGRMHPNPLQMMPFGFGPMPSFFSDFRDMTPHGNCHSFMTSSMMTMASGPDGRPQVYQETMSTTTAPGGVKETKKTVSDSRTGLKKMAIGHHIGDRAHILEREQNVHSGEREERQEFINLDEDEAETFNDEWETRTRRSGGAIGSSRYSAHGGSHNRSRADHRQLALTDAPASRHFSSSRGAPSVKRALKSPSTSKTQSSAHVSSVDSSGLAKSANAKPSVAATTTSTTAAATAVASVASSSATVTGNRKREHTPDTKVSKKRHAVSDSDA